MLKNGIKRLVATYWLGLLSIIIIPSCNYNLNNLDIPDWELELLGPIAQTELKLEDLVELQDLVFIENIGINELGLPVGVIPFPMIALPVVGPVEKRIFDQFELLEADSVYMKVTLTNEFPFTLKQGTQLNFNNEISGSLIFSFPLSEDLESNESTSIEVILLNTEVEPVLSITATNFSTGSTQGVLLESNDRAILTFEMIFIRLSDVYILPDKSVSFKDTVGFNLQGTGLSATALEGTLNLFVENTYPLEGEVQAYFFNSSETIVDSLLDPRGVIELPLLAGTNVVESKESKLSAEISQDRINRLNTATKMFIFFELGTPSGSEAYHAKNLVGFNTIMTGDLKIQITN